MIELFHGDCRHYVSHYKGRLFDAMRELDGVVLKAPVAIGDVVVENLLGLGVDLVATKNVPAR